MINRLMSLVVALLLSCAVNATDVYLMQIDGLHQDDNQGAYDIILQEAMDGISSDVNVKLVSPDESLTLFENCSDCCTSPANNSAKFYDWKGKVEELQAFNYAKVYIFSALENPAYTSVSQLKGKRVGTRSGMPYGTDVDKANLNVIPVDNIQDNINKLNAGKLDAFLAYVPDAYQAFKNANMKPLAHALANPAAIHIDRMICRGAPAKFTNSLNKKLKNMRSTGKLRRILGDSFIKPF